MIRKLLDRNVLIGGYLETEGVAVTRTFLVAEDLREVKFEPRTPEFFFFVVEYLVTSQDVATLIPGSLTGYLVPRLGFRVH